MFDFLKNIWDLIAYFFGKRYRQKITLHISRGGTHWVYQKTFLFPNRILPRQSVSWELLEISDLFLDIAIHHKKPLPVTTHSAYRDGDLVDCTLELTGKKIPHDSFELMVQAGWNKLQAPTVSAV